MGNSLKKGRNRWYKLNLNCRFLTLRCTVRGSLRSRRVSGKTTGEKRERRGEAQRQNVGWESLWLLAIDTTLNCDWIIVKPKFEHCAMNHGNELTKSTSDVSNKLKHLFYDLWWYLLYTFSEKSKWTCRVPAFHYVNGNLQKATSLTLLVYGDREL